MTAMSVLPTPASASVQPLRTSTTAVGRACTHLGVPAALATAIGVWNPSHRGGPALCPWRAITGEACPGCGLTRATGSLFRGQWHDALAMHPLVPLLVLQVALFCALYVAWGDSLRRRMPGWLAPTVLIGNTIALVAVWAVRSATGDIDVVLS